MEKLKSITIISLLAVGFLTSNAPAKTVSVLLQEGLYAEEIQGDLDGAIKIYEQVISESKDTQRAAAQATYRIGMCYLKQGEKAKAAEQFQNVISKYPEQKTLFARAREQLIKLGPTVTVGFDSAEFVPVDQLIKSGKVPAFKTQIYDNTGLDLDTGVSVPFMDEWPTLCDVAWDNDEGGALMIKPKSSVRFIALGGAEKWEDAISMARNSLAVLRTSTSKGMFASESKFGTVLTSEGNLAVIQIGEYDDKKGTIYGWVEKIPAEVYCFGPVKEVTLIDVDHTITKGKPCAINFATGSVMTIPRQPQMSANDAIEWVRRRGIDAVAESESGLIGVDMAIVTMPSENWDTITPMELRTLQVPPNLRSQKTIQMSYYEGQDQPIYAFRTRKDQYGTLQIIDVNKQNQDVRFRYKMLQGRVENTAIANALSVAEAFLSAAISGRESEAIKLVKPGSAVAQQVKEFQEIAEKDKVKVVSVYGDEEAALAITAEVRVGPDEKGQISIRLIKQRGNWMVEDVDLEIPASLKTEIDSFLQKHPNATKLQEDQFRYKTLQEQAKSPIDLSTPEATIKSFVKAVYDGNLEAAKACVSKDGHDYDEFMEMLATESNHPFQAMIKAMDASIPVEITSKDITEDRCKIKWYFTLGRVYYIGDDETKWKKGMHPEFSSYLELVGDKWLIRDI